MRTKTNRSRLSVGLAAVLGIVLMSLATPALAGDAVSVVKTSVSGGVVSVTVKNNTLLPQVGTVSVQAVVNDTAVWSLVPVTLLPGQSAMVNAAFTAAVKSVQTVGIACGMSDDGIPY